MQYYAATKWVQYMIYLKIFPTIKFLCFYISNFIIIIIILIITIIHLLFIYHCMPETMYVSVVCSVAAVLYLQFLLYVVLFLPGNMFLH
jgi:hypothetical protein